MALDKLVDSAQLDSDLGDVADAIRAKSGGENALEFPSGFLTEIASIAGLPSGISAFKTGTITFASGKADITVTHNLGVTPKVFVFFLDGKWYNSLNNSVLYAQYILYPTGDSTRNVRTQTTSSSTTLANGTSTMVTFDSTTANFKRSQSSQGQAVATQIVDGVGTTEAATYRWFAIA